MKGCAKNMADEKKGVRKLNPETDTPEKILEVSKAFMTGYLKAKGTVDDKKWFAALVEKNLVERTIPTSGKKYRDYKLKVVRAAFIERFFPALSASQESCQDMIDEILSWK